MSWLEPEGWLTACKATAAGLRAPYVERGGEDALVERLAGDPRRCVALVGPQGSGTSRLALELARRAPWARYRDPIAPPEPRAEVAALEVPDIEGRPVVVVDGPDRGEAMSVLAELLAQRLHPRLLVIVPCSDRVARRLSRIGGEYPRGSILVAGLADPGAPPPHLPESISHEALAPFALAGRCAAGQLPGEAALVDAGALARHGASGTVVCLADERRRFEVSREVLLTDEVALTALLDRRPELRRRCFETTLRWLGGNVPEPALEHLAAFGAEDFPDLADFARRGVLVAPPVLVQLVRRAMALLPATEDPDQAALLRLQVARGVAFAGDEAKSVEHLDAALALPCGDAMRGALLYQRAAATVDPDQCGEAVALLRAAGDAVGLRDAMRRWVELLRARERGSEALARARELIEVEEQTGGAIDVGRACTLASSVAAPVATIPEAIALAEDAAEAHAAVGDVRGQTLALYRIASLRVALEDAAGARVVVQRALEAERAIDNPAGIGYAAWMLGALADKAANPAAAATHYAESIAAYEAAGRVPDRVRESLRLAEERAAGGGGAPAEIQLPPEEPEDPDPAEGRLIQLRIPPREE